MDTVNEPATAYKKEHDTIAEYLEMEKASPEKHEYYLGAVFATAGAGRRHHIIFKNTLGQLYMLLSGNACQPYGSDMRIHIPENTLFTYPDISIICGDMVAPAEDENTAVLPAVLIEILPPLQKIMTAAENSGCTVISLL